MFEDRETLWVVHIGNNDHVAARALEEGFICIGWTVIGDLSPHNTRAKMRAAYEKALPDKSSGSVTSSYGQPFRFAHEMQVGDPVVYPIKGASEIAIGRITGEYRFAEDDRDLVKYDYCNIRRVEWLKKEVPRTAFSQAALHSFGSFTSVSTSNDYLEEIEAILAREKETPTPDTVTPEPDEETHESNLYESALQETEDYLLKAWQGSGAPFEHVVAAVLEAIGYTAKVTQASRDHGVDVIAHPDPLGLEKPFIKVQAKSGASAVGDDKVNQLKGCLNAGEKGILVSLGKFTSDAKAVARSSPDITLMDAKEFVALFLDHYEQLDPGWRAKYPLKRVFVPFR